MPDPGQAFARWVDLLGPGGVVVLIEGNWATGAGLTANDCERIMRGVRQDVKVRSVLDPIYWGKQIRDERYIAVSPR